MARLGDLERAVLDSLWQSGEPLTVREVHEALTERQLAYTTVMTTLQRLARKGLVTQDTQARAHRFSAVATREEMFTELMTDALGIAGDESEAMLRFVDNIGPEARAALAERLRPEGRTS
ncbi:BlaI/MecI/CopY family transcriptional regulator [Streptomyces sp. b94]|uniref:BlaI/MecI/CopY family transcriptional regulator n=1 Tax=Streptomyces sp. b94 TaxID=1827634 RepID=UPI001FFCEBFD|nr:BlaI/MecI/CopY family transcriptional regulator [Streptomyces sp. b94]